MDTARDRHANGAEGTYAYDSRPLPPFPFQTAGHAGQRPAGHLGLDTNQAHAHPQPLASSRVLRGTPSPREELLDASIIDDYRTFLDVPGQSPRPRTADAHRNAAPREMDTRDRAHTARHRHVAGEHTLYNVYDDGERRPMPHASPQRSPQYDNMQYPAPSPRRAQHNHAGPRYKDSDSDSIMSSNSKEIPIRPPSSIYPRQEAGRGRQEKEAGLRNRQAQNGPAPLAGKGFPLHSRFSVDESNYATPQGMGKRAPSLQELLDTTPYGVHYHKGSAILLMIALCVCVLMVGLDAPILTSVLHPIRDEIDWKDRDDMYAWIGAAFILAWVVVAPIWGAFTVVLPIKLVMVGAQVTLIAGSVLCGFARDSDTFLAGRAIQGVGGCGIAASGNLVLHGLFPETKRGELLRVMGIILGLGAPLGPVAGGTISHALSWRWCLLVNIPVVCVCGFIMTLLMLPERKKERMAQLYSPDRKRVAWASIFSVIPPIVIFMVSLQHAGIEKTDSSARILFLPMIGVVWWGLCAFVEWKVSPGGYAIVTMRMLRQPGTVVCLVYALLHSFSINAGPFFMSYYFNAVQGFSAIMNAVHLIPFLAASTITWIAQDAFNRRCPGRDFPVLLAGHVIMVIGFALYMDLGADYDLARLVGYQVVTAVGGTMTFTATLGVLEQDLHDQDIESAGNAIDFMRVMSMVLALAFGNLAYEAEIHAQYPGVVAKVGDRIAKYLNGLEDTANAELEALPMETQLVVREAIAAGMRKSWLILLGMVGASALLLPVLWWLKRPGKRGNGRGRWTWKPRAGQ